MVPSLPESIACQLLFLPVSLKDDRTPDDDLTGLSCGNLTIDIIDDLQIDQRTRLTGGPGSFGIGTHGREPHGLRLTIGQPELAMTEAFKSLDRIGQFHPKDMLQREEAELSITVCIEQ